MDQFVKKRMAEPSDNDRWWPAARRHILRELFSTRLPPRPNRRILEVGCGPGWNIPMLAEFGEVTAIESDASFVACARATAPEATVVHGDVPLSCLNGKYDMICMLDVLEHLEDDAGAIRWATQFLEEDGCLCIAAPAFAFLWSRHDIASHHFRRYTMADLESLLRAEFRIVHRTYFNFWLFPLAFIAAGIRRLSAPLPKDFRKVGACPATLKHSRLERVAGGLLYHIFASERFILKHIRLPFGVTAFVIAQRREQPIRSPQVVTTQPTLSRRSNVASPLP